MATQKITITTVKKLAQEGGWIWDTDCAGFGARRQTRDVHFYLRYRLGGKQHMKRIGRLGSPWTPETARQLARVGLGEVARGLHPIFGNGHAKPTGQTFGELVPRFLERKREELRPKTFAELARHLKVHAAPLSGLRLAEIDKRAIAKHLDEIETGSGGITRNRVRVSLSAFFNWANRQALAEGNPVHGTDTVKERRRDRVLSDAELAQVWKALPPGDFGDILRLLILTGQRRNEIALLEWKEVDLGKGLIRLGPERTKNKHLNHRGGHKAGVAGTYNRSAYPEEVREALARWADHITAITSA